MTFDIEEFPALEKISVGDIVRNKYGKRFRFTKVTRTAVAVVPYRWYHAAYDWITKA